MPTTISASHAGRALYHSVWLDVKKLFFDQDSLKKWSRWEHCYDHAIKDRATARKYIAKMLASLRDPYTRLLSDEETAAEERDDETSEQLVCAEDLGKGIGYVCISGFGQTNIVDQLKTELEKVAHLNGFIIDLRGNRGGLVDRTANCIELVLHEGTLVTLGWYTEQGIESSKVELTPDTFVRTRTVNGGKPEVDYFIRQPALIAHKPLVLLVDKNTMSSAELFAATLLRNKDKVSILCLGDKTHGKGIGQTLRTYSDGSAIRLSNLRFYSADDKWLGDCGRSVSNGIVPDRRFTEFKPMVRFAFRHLREQVVLEKRRKRTTRGFVTTS